MMFAPRDLKDFIAANTKYRGDRFCGSTRQTERRAAEAVEREERERAKVATKVATPGMSLDQAAQRYWQEVAQHQVGANNTKHDLAFLIDHFGKERRLDTITGDDVAKLVAWRRGHRVPTTGKLVNSGTVDRTTKMLRRLFAYAKEAWHLRFDREPIFPMHSQKRLGSCNEQHEASASLAPDGAAICCLGARASPTVRCIHRFSRSSIRPMSPTKSVTRFPSADSWSFLPTASGRRGATAARGCGKHGKIEERGSEFPHRDHGHQRASALMCSNRVRRQARHSGENAHEFATMVKMGLPGCGGRAVEKHGGYRVARRQRRDLIACCIKPSVSADQKGTGLLLDKGRKGPLIAKRRHRNVRLPAQRLAVLPLRLP
jgi:hypothetical protein